MLRNTVIALLLAAMTACGDDASTPSPGTDGGSQPIDASLSTQDAATVADATVTDGAVMPIDAGAMGQNVFEVISNDPDLSTFAAAIARAEVATTFANPGPFTVFAPSNAAFRASGIDVGDFSIDELRELVLYHLVPGERRSDALEMGPLLTVANLTTFVQTEGGLRLNRGNEHTFGADIGRTDLEASNGVVHIIERVTRPPTVLFAATYGYYTGFASMVSAGTETDSGSLVALLSGAGPFTVFVPTDDAVVAANITDPDAIRDTVLNHTVEGSVTRDSLPRSARSMLGQTLTFNPGAMPPTISSTGGTSNMVLTDIRATNGILHIVDPVLP